MKREYVVPRRYARPEGASLGFEVSGVALDELLLVLGKVVDRVNRIRGTDGDAGAAVDALYRVDKELSGSFEGGLILLGMNAVGGANIDAERVLDAGIGDYVGHDEVSVINKESRYWRSFANTLSRSSGRSLRLRSGQALRSA